MRKLSVLIYALCLALVLRAQKTLAVSPVTSTEGYDFYATFLPNGTAQRNAPDLKLQFLVSSREVPGHPEITENTVVVQCGSFRQEYPVAVNSTEVIDMDADLAYWDITHEKDNVETPLTLGVHIYSKNGVKMTVYAVNQIGTTDKSLSLDGSHVLPKQALGHEYIVACNKEDNIATEFVVMSTAAGTNIKIQLPDNVKTSKGSTGTLTATFPQPYQIYIVRATADPENPANTIDLSGATICTDRPVAVWSGNQTAVFTTDLPNATFDHAFEQLLPIDRWGTEFIVPLTGLHTQINKVDIIARDNDTKVTLTTAQGPQTKDNMLSGEKWSRLIDAYHVHGFGATLEDSTVVIKADKPIQVNLFTSSAVYNGYLVNNIPQYQGDPSMTMITPLEHLTDTAVFATYQNPLKEIQPMSYELVVWAKKTTIPTLKRNGTAVPPSLFKNLPGNVYSGYQYARIPIPSEEEGYQILTAAEKGFGGYVYGLENSQACLYPIGYDCTPVEDSLFLSKKYEPKEVHGADFNTKYPDKANGGGWYLDKVVLPNIPTQYDTIFICDSTKLRFPAIIHNDWDAIKWEVMRINQSNQARTEYTHVDDATHKYEYQEGGLSNPFLETRFFVLPEKDRSARQRHPYEDFEVRAILYRQPILCDETEQDNWQKDTLSTIVRTFRSYNDTTWLIRCTNDPDIVEQDGKYYIKFFVNPETKESVLTPLVVGENGVDGNSAFTQYYTTVNGCENDSIATLRVLLCQSDVKVLDLGYLCEDDLADVPDQLKDKQFGDFFKNFDFPGTFTACKNNGNIGANGWTYLGDSKLYWQFESTDIILKTDCSDKMQEWIDKYGATLHSSRKVLGCDNSLKLSFYVWPIKEYIHDDETTCNTRFTWSLDYNWYDGRFTKHIDIPYQVGVDGIHEGTNVCVYNHPRATYPAGTSFSGCVGERHILHLTFLHHDETRIKEKELCKDDPLLIVDKRSDRDIKDETFEWVFNPRDSLTGVVYYSPEIECVNSDGCPYIIQYKVTVNPVETHYDTVVYCYDDGTQIEHKWPEHSPFWAYEKGKPNTRKRYHNETNPLRINRSKTARIVYELADTIVDIPCHRIYYQTVILQPIYETKETYTPISTQQWFEWHGVIWAGERVLTDTIPNPGGKPIAVLQEYGVVPEGWTVVPGKNMYTLTTTITTRPYTRDDGALTDVCDSTVTLQVPVADVQEEHTYAWACSNETPYTWQAGDTIISVDLQDYYTDLSELPKTVRLEEHRKTVSPPWPVAGLDAHFYRHLTIYPAYVTTEDTTLCQVPGETRTFKGIEFSVDKDTVLISGNDLKTKTKYWTDPETGDQEPVECDSIEGVRMFVLPIYREDANKDRSTYERTLYTYDTLRFFTNPQVLFVGQDFFLTHPSIKNLEELKTVAKVDSAVIITEELIEKETAGALSGIYHSSQLSDGTQGSISCDSTTFLNITVNKTSILPAINLGDNGDVMDEGVTEPWHFGGDTTVARADGTRYHTFAYTTGDYFRYYYDENGNVIDEVDYFDPSTNRGSRDYHYNADGTRTYLLIDTVLNADGSFEVFVQNVTVYPTYLVNANVSESLGTVEVCASDTYHWVGHRDIVVSEQVLKNRHATATDTLCAKQYLSRGICVDSICILDLVVFGDGVVREPKNRCFNDPKWAPDWKRDSVCYKAGTTVPDTIRNIIQPQDPTVTCIDTREVIVSYTPAYGVWPCEGDEADLRRFRAIYIEPYTYDTMVCYNDDDFHWLLRNGEEHIPSNLYLFDSAGNPINRYTDAKGNATNKVSGNIVPTDLEIGHSYIVRDSLKTVACFCDSVLTLYYEILESLPPITMSTTICEGETYQFGDTILSTAGTYVRFVQEEGKPCKTKTTLTLSVVKSSQITVEPTPVCFGEANTEATYAIRYSYKGGHPTSFSIQYADDAHEIGFVDIIDQAIVRPESEWKVDSVYALDLPIPQLETREDYPTPGVYHATISFQNGTCSGAGQMTYDIEVKVNYPAWVMVQRHGDLIVLLDENNNGGYAWNGFQWYRNGQKMFGYTKPYLYVPEGLIYDSEQTAEYHVVLTETDITGAVISSEPTCPIVVKAMPNSSTDPGKDHGPSSDYIAVTPTCVPRGGSIHILSLNENSSGEYRINTVDGQFISKGTYHGQSTPVSIPSVEGMYIVQVWSSDKESKESYRAIKVIVKDTCPNCDKSSF